MISKRNPCAVSVLIKAVKRYIYIYIYIAKEFQSNTTEDIRYMIKMNHSSI